MILRNEDYELVYKKGTDDEIIFKCKLLTVKEVKTISGFLGQSKEDLTNNAVEFSLKLIELSIIGWDNVLDEVGNRIEFNPDNLNRLPYDVFNFLAEEVMKRNNLVPPEEEKIKNS